MKPDDAAIPRNYSICGAERLAGEEHLRGFQAPALLIIGVNVLIPANRILQPFFPRISEGRFNLRAHIRFTDTPVEMGHENNRRYLLQKGAVFRLKVWSVRIRRRLMAIFSEIIQNRIQGRVDKYFRKIEEDGLRFGDIRQARIDVNEVALWFSDRSRSRRHLHSRRRIFRPTSPTISDSPQNPSDWRHSDCPEAAFAARLALY